jgi:hypothetical protein
MPVMLGMHDPTRDIAILLGGTAVLVGAAYWMYGRRDL